jgi:DNA-binding transcriptional ArsR family regulator
MSIDTYTVSEVKHLGQIFKLLSEPNRLRIILSLGLECCPVSDIVHATGLSQTNVSFHLRALREAGLVRPERRGPLSIIVCPTGDCSPARRLASWMKRRHEDALDE